jgi:predicted histone-like DNA-binding protein
MAVHFKVVRKKNPIRKDEDPKFYAQAMVTGKVTLDKLCNRVARVSTASRGDVQLVICALMDEVIDSLEDGNTVRLGDLGCMRISLSSTGEETPSEVSAGNIRKGRIVFTPSVMLKERVARLSFQQWPSPTPAPEAPETPETPGGGGDEGGGDYS